MRDASQIQVRSSEKKATMGVPTFRVVYRPEEKFEIFKFRYQVYIEEMQRKVSSADHGNHMIRDHLDDSAVIVGVFDGDEVVGTCAINFSSDAPIHYCEELYETSAFEKLFPKQVAIITKLMIRPEYRKGSTFLRLMKFMYRILLERGAKVNLIDCNDHLVDTFAKLGFRHYKGKSFHKDYGSVTPMVMFNFEGRHLKTVRSPLLPVLNDFNRQAEAKSSVRWIMPFAWSE